MRRCDTCPGGFFCGTILTSTRGFCTTGCPSVGDNAPCQSNYPSPGVPICLRRVRALGSGTEQFACAIMCGTNFGGADACPAEMRCVDVINDGTWTPGSDGANDFCVE